MLVDDYFAAVTALDEAAVARLLHPQALITERPNPINPEGTIRDRAAALAALGRAKDVLAEHRYEVHDHVIDGDRVATKVTWRATLADGRALTAHVAAFLQIRDGRIYRHETYDCYDAF